jgi:hypothetical protein
MPRVRWESAVGGPLPLPISWAIARDASPRRRRMAGSVRLPAHHAETAIHWGCAVQQVVGQHPPRRGSARFPAYRLPSPVQIAFVLPTRPVRDSEPKRRRAAGLARLERFASPGVPPAIPFATPTRIARDTNPFRRRVAGHARLAGLLAPLIQYHVYANTGAGDPINYATPIGTVDGLTWSSLPLAYPGNWAFSVRAFYSSTGLEEQNLDCAVTLLLDAAGNDITDRPRPPTGLRALAVAGGNIKVEWSGPNPVTPGTRPSGFHIYIGVGPLSYAAPAATVSYGSSIDDVFTATLTGLANRTSYTIGVRSFNATAEEPNTITVTCTADSVGPSAVQSLAAIAV